MITGRQGIRTWSPHLRRIGARCLMRSQKQSMRRLNPLLLVILLLTLNAAGARAQGAVRAWGMAGAHTAVARGLEAVEYNPANLALSQGVTIGLAGFAVDVHNNAFSLDRFNELTGSHLSTSQKERLLADIPLTGLQLDANAQASLLGFQVGPFALSTGVLGAGQGNLDRDYFDLVLFGNHPGETVDFSNTWGQGFAMATATASWGQTLHQGESSRLCVGANLRYFHGIYEMHVEEAYGQINTTLEEITGEASVTTLSSEGGRGYGLDLGLAMQTGGGWSFGLVADNLVTDLHWDKFTEINEFTLMAQDINLLNDDLDEALAEADTTYSALSYHTTLPRRLRLGASHQTGSWLMAMDYVQGLENGPGSSTTPQFNTGFELQALSFLQPRFGVCIGGACGTSLAGGLGLRLGFWRLDLAVANRGGLIPGNAKGLVFAAGTMLQF